MCEERREVDISVVILTYFHEPYIAKCLDSVLAQETNLRVDILVGDDASQDGTPEIIRDYAARYPNRIQTVFHKENVGATRNGADVGALIRGKYVAYLEGDDYWLDPHKLQKQWEILEAHPEYSACCGRCVLIDENGQTNYTRTPHFVWNRRLYTLEDLVDTWNIPGQMSTLMYRTALNGVAPEAAVLAYQAHRTVGDKTQTLLLLAHGPIYCSGEILSAYRSVDKSGGHNWFSIHHSNPYRNYDMFMYPCKLEAWAREYMELPADKHFGKRNPYRFCRFVEELVREPSWTRAKYLAGMVRASHQPLRYAWLILKALIEME